MREVKFRIWNGRQMEYNIMAGFLGAFYVQGIDEKDTASMSPFNTKYDKETPLMQFTGLLDKNGKEIYESDIIRTVHFKTKQEINYMFHKVVCDNERATFNAINLLNDDELLTTNGNCFLYVALKESSFEVIGNVYSNPKLIK